jgi:hypothetical protein
MSEACPGEHSYVGVLRVAGARATRGGGVEPRARTDDAVLNPRGCWGPVGDGRERTAKLHAECHFTGKTPTGGLGGAASEEQSPSQREGGEGGEGRGEGRWALRERPSLGEPHEPRGSRGSCF